MAEKGQQSSERLRDMEENNSAQELQSENDKCPALTVA